MSLTESPTDLRTLDESVPGIAKVACDLKQDHIFLIAINLLDVESEVNNLKRIEAEGSHSNPVLARWSTGACQSNPTSARSNVGVGSSSSTAPSPRRDVHSSLEVETISHPLSRIRVTKTI